MENIKNINQRIKELEKEKKEIQDNCTHKEKCTKFLEGTNNIRIFCKECAKMISYPTQKQINQFLNIKTGTMSCNNCNCEDGKCLKDDCNCDNCNCRINETSSLED